jgi:redox-sensitive bicupin YhaK (pirin superfamily)
MALASPHRARVLDADGSYAHGELSSYAAQVALRGVGSDVVVRVVTGTCDGVRAAPPLNHGVTLLDVSMRPGETVQLPLNLTQGVLLYVLQGVALFGTSPALRPSLPHITPPHGSCGSHRHPPHR